MISDFFKKTRNRKIALIVILLGVVAVIIFFIAKTFMKPKINQIRLKEDFTDNNYTGLTNINGILHPIGYYNISLNQNLFRIDPASNTLETVSGLTQSNDVNTIFMLLLYNKASNNPIGTINNNRYTDYIVFPLKNSLYVNSQPGANGIVTVKSTVGEGWNNFKEILTTHPFRFIEINGRNYIRQNGSNNMCITR